jgi:acyl-CoA thioester hydrolase
MYSNQINTRVRYAETDQMGVVYYGNYPQFFEIGRVEALRALGISYKEMEKKGIMLPVLKLEVKYLAPATYDDLILIQTEIHEMPKARITFQHKIKSEEGKLLTLGMVQLVFVDVTSRKPILCPSFMSDALAPFLIPKNES